MASTNADSKIDQLITFDQDADSIGANNIVIIANSYTSKSGSLAREFLSKQAMRDNVAEELGIPGNSDVALQAVADFERSINAKLEDEGVEDEEGQKDSLGHQNSNDQVSFETRRKSSIPDDFVSYLAYVMQNKMVPLHFNVQER